MREGRERVDMEGQFYADDAVIAELEIRVWCPINHIGATRYCGICCKEADGGNTLSGTAVGLRLCSCGELGFCSDVCREGHRSATDHWLLCGKGKLSRELHRKLAAQPLLRLCACLFAHLVGRAQRAVRDSCHLCLKDALTFEYQSLQAAFPSQVPVQGMYAASEACVAEKGPKEYDDDEPEEQEKEEEEWSNVDEVLVLLLGVVRHETAVDQPELVDALDYFPTSVEWDALYRACRLHHCVLSLPSSAVARSRALPLERDVAKKRAAYEKLCASLHMPSAPVHRPSTEGDLPLPTALGPHDDVAAERNICHLAQTAATPGVTAFTPLSLEVLALVHAVLPQPTDRGAWRTPGTASADVFPHCCAPSAAMEAYRDAASQALRCRLVASRRIDPTVEQASRAYPLPPRLAASCPCFRCEFGRLGLAGAERALRNTEAMGRAQAFAKLRLLAFAALAEQDFARAHAMLRLLVSRASQEGDGGDVHHAMGSTLLALGQWRAAHRAWAEGAVQCPGHGGLRDAVDRVDAYAHDDAAADSSQAAPGPALAPEACFMLRRAGLPPSGPALIFMSKRPLLSEQECLWCVREAEDFAQLSGGWTTARHYSAPTTDVPLQSLPAVLTLLKAVVLGRLKGCLARMFFPHAKGPVAVCIHDAFVVRYSHSLEASQTHLPLHQDESTHSLTIALNSAGEFEGGGTFFQMLDCAVKPDMGHVLGFDGSLVHGGDPITSGVRYIIAVFLILSAEGVEEGAQGDADPDPNPVPGKCRRVEADGKDFAFDFSLS